MKRIGILFHPKVPASLRLADDLEHALRERGVDHWLDSAWEQSAARSRISGTDLVVTLGGDGTILRAARIIIPHAVPILAVNLGRLGFLTEVPPGAALPMLLQAHAGEGWIEERMMLATEVCRGGQQCCPAGEIDPSLHALNDVVVGRGSLSRVVRIRTTVDGSPFTTYTADGVIVSSPTGSTGYSLAAGGPILHPQMDSIVLTPIAPYLSLSKAVLLPATVDLELAVQTDHHAALSVDGQIEIALETGDVVRVRRSPYLTRFLRLRPPSYFLSTLTERLGREVTPCWSNSASPTSP